MDQQEIVDALLSEMFVKKEKPSGLAGGFSENLVLTGFLKDWIWFGFQDIGDCFTDIG
jgi:hypothetical protein